MATGKTPYNKLMVMVLAGTTVAAESVWSAVTTAGPFEQAAITVAEGQSETETGLLQHDSQSSGFSKEGAGDYTLPFGAVVQKTPLNIFVRQGKVSLSEDSSSATVEAPACLQKAAMWLDANDLAAGAVETWLDHRDVTAGQNMYPCMKQTTVEKQPTAGTDGASKAWVYFGGYGSGKYGAFFNAARTGTTKIEVVHAFLVAKVVDSSGFWFGMNNSYYVSFHASLTGATYWGGIDSSPAVLAGQTFIDGERIDGSATSVKAGVQLIEWEAGECAAPIMNFFNDRSIAGRSGGDNIGEVLLFTSRLSSVERQQVEMYLMKKWESDCQPGRATVRLAEGAIVALEGGETVPVTVRGDGTVDKTTAGSLYFGDAVQGASDAAMHVTSGELILEKGEIKLAVGSGEALLSSKDAYGVTTLTRSADVEAGAAAVSGGAGAYRLEKIPSTVSNLTLTCGTLALGSRTDSADGVRVRTTSAGLFATMSNPGFESFDGQRKKNDMFWTESGWTFTKGTSYSDWFVFKKNVGNYSSYGGNVPMPEGIYSMGFNFHRDDPRGATATASTQVSFPKDGDYLLTFADAPRYPTWSPVDNYNTYAGTAVELALTREGFARNSIATYYVNGLYTKDAYRPQRFLVRDVKAGDYTFEINMTKTVDVGERLSIFDDFKFRLVESDVAEFTCPVPNGDFEHYSLTTPETFDLNRTAEGWTFSDTAGGEMAAVGPLTPQVLGAVGGSSSADATYMRLPLFLNASSFYGQGQLAFFGNQGTATTAAFVPQQGNWRLRCRVAHSPSSMMNWNGQAINGDGVFQAGVSVNGAAEQVLGTLTVTSTLFVTETFPAAFACDGTEFIVLTLRQTKASGNLRVDDLELVRDDNLVAGGDFSSLSAWTTDSWIESPDFSRYYGKTVLDGKALNVTRQASAAQMVSFPEAGTYRLSFWACGRAYYVNEDDALPLMSLAQNRIRFYLAKDSSEREIYRTEKINSTNFVHYAAIFKVDTAGEYTFGLQGTETNDRSAWIDNVRIEKVAAASAPELPENATILVRLSEGEKLRLDYPGSAIVRELKVNGRALRGEVNETTCPDYVTGPGTINATFRPGFFMVFR